MNRADFIQHYVLVKTIGPGDEIQGYTETIVQVERPH